MYLKYCRYIPYFSLAWLYWLMAYQPSWVIKCQSHTYRRTIVWWDKEVDTFPQGC